MTVFSIESRTGAVKQLGDLGYKIDSGAGYCIAGVLPAKGVIAEANKIVAAGKDKIIDTPLYNKLFSVYSIRDINHPFIKLALRDDVVATVSEYMSFVPVLSRMHVFYTQHSDMIKYTQYWHCDREEPKTIKLMMCINDIDNSDGPIHVIDAKTTKKIAERFPKVYGSHVKDAVLEKEFPDVHDVSISGPAGTTWFLDTNSCLHYGSRVTKGHGPRVWLMMQFVHPDNKKSHHNMYRDWLNNLSVAGLPAHKQMIIKT